MGAAYFLEVPCFQPITGKDSSIDTLCSGPRCRMQLSVLVRGEGQVRVGPGVGDQRVDT